MFRKAIASTIAFDVLSRAVGAATALLLIHTMKVSQYAFLTVFLAISQFVGTSVTGGLRMRHLQDEAERRSRGDARGSDFAAIMSGQIVLVLCAVSVVLLVADLAGLKDVGASLLSVSALVALYALGQAISDLAIAHDQANLWFVRAGLVMVARNALLLIVACSSLAGVTSGITIALLSGLALLGTSAVLAGAILHETGSPGLTVRTVVSPRAGWLTAYYIGASGYANIDVLVVAAVLSAVDVATFGAAQRCYLILLGLFPGLIAVLRVRTSQADIVDSPKIQREMIVRWMRRTIPLLIIGLGAAAALAPILIPVVLGGRYPRAVALFQLYLIPVFTLYCLAPAQTLMLAQRRYKTLALVVMIGLTANALADVGGAMIGGLLGLTAASVSVEVVQSITIAAILLRGLRLETGGLNSGAPYNIGSTKQGDVEAAA